MLLLPWYPQLPPGSQRQAPPAKYRTPQGKAVSPKYHESFQDSGSEGAQPPAIPEFRGQCNDRSSTPRATFVNTRSRGQQDFRTVSGTGTSPTAETKGSPSGGRGLQVAPPEQGGTDSRSSRLVAEGESQTASSQLKPTKHTAPNET